MQQRGVIGRPILSGVRRDKGFCGVAGEAPYKLIHTLPCDASTVISAGGLESLLSHRCSGVGSETAKSEEPPPPLQKSEKAEEVWEGEEETLPKLEWSEKAEDVGEGEE